ncbi:hypothetical protein VWX74_22830, partial [Xanthomonas citri pv. citri]
SLSAQPEATLSELTRELDETYRRVAARLPQNDAVRFENVGDKEATLSELTRELDETYRRVAARLPQNDAVRFENVGDKTELVLS